MELGFIGLGRMGGSMAARMLKSKGMRVVVWNRSPEPVKEAVAKGAIGSASLRELVGLLKQKRKIVWMMLPSGDVTEKAFRELLTLLKKGDIIIEGANSNFNDSIRRHKEAAKKGIEMLDVGVSGGVVAAKRGYALMAGGTKQTYGHCKPLFDAIGYPEGYGLVGGPGAGHYVKMVHNAIEYGMMQSIAEGFDLLKKGSYPHVDAKQVAHLWNHGTIVQSFLMEMVENALSKDGNLTARSHSSRIPAKGNGRPSRPWTSPSPSSRTPTPCTRATSRGTRTPSPLSSWRPCAMSSAGMK